MEGAGNAAHQEDAGREEHGLTRAARSQEAEAGEEERDSRGGEDFHEPLDPEMHDAPEESRVVRRGARHGFGAIVGHGERTGLGVVAVLTHLRPETLAQRGLGFGVERIVLDASITLRPDREERGRLAVEPVS